MDYLDRTNQLSEKFHGDSEVNELIEKLKAKFKEKFNEVFADEYSNTGEFEEGRKKWAEMMESEPDEITIFDVLWFI